MQESNLWGILNTPLISGVIIAILTPILALFISTRLKFNLLKQLPDYIKDAGINPLLYRLSYVRFDLGRITLLSKSKKIVLVIFSLSLAIFLVFYLFFSLRLIITTPAGYANLTLNATGEVFLLSENNAMSYPDKSLWKFDQDMCHSDLFPNLAGKYNISYKLVYMICTTVGLQREKQNVENLVEDCTRSKVYLLVFSFFFSVYVIGMVMSIMAPVIITPKLIKYREEYLRKKFI
ncbi:hypothetical protein SAMN04487787_102223 [Kosakonia sacchari]|nr:hypothetical protein SAMN04487787_102223 [Kosakonia sacchari]